MAAQVSFDVTSSVDLQEVDNAVNQAAKELAQRYDFKGSKASIAFKRAESLIELVADDNFKMDALWDILQTRMIRRGVPVKNLKTSETEPIAGSLVKRTVTLQQGIPTDAAKSIVKFLKDQKLKKVQANIQGDQLRVTSPSKDELQATMRLLKGQDFGVELQFGNYRE
jgi:cyclic-di-GMP-binding protein